MSAAPEHLKQYFGYDKISLFGVGPMPAAPPAPPGTTARKAGDNAVANAVATARAPGVRPGARPAVAPQHPGLSARMRAKSEAALLEHSMHSAIRARGGTPPRRHAGMIFGAVFAPIWAKVPWDVKRVVVSRASGVRNYSARS